MIVVTGATGSIGRELVRALVESGERVRAVVRRPGVTLPGAEVVHADLDDPSTLPAAFAGADRLLLNTGGAGPVEGPLPMLAQQCAAIDAAVDARIGHVVKISVIGAGVGRPLANGAHGEIERHLAGSGLPATVLRPNGFLQNLLTGVAGFTPDGGLLDPFGGGAMAYLDTDDIAACAAAVLTGRAPAGGIHELTGPRAITHADIAAALSGVLGRSVPVVPVTPDDMLAQGLPVSFAEGFAQFSREIAAGSLRAVTDDVRRLAGREPRDVADFVVRHADALRAIASTAAYPAGVLPPA